MDSEEFLTDLQIRGVAGNTTTAANVNNNYLFRVVTQRYGKGIVQYGENQNLVFPNSETGGGGYYDICDQNGFIYLEVDLQVPVCISCGDSSLDGYTGSTFSSSTESNNAFLATYRIYKNLEF